MAHTPGPWKIEALAIMGRCFTGQWKAICGVVRGGTPEEKFANCNLIAAAPDLLFALQQIVGDLPSKRDWLDPNIEHLAKQAIQKAKGGQS